QFLSYFGVREGDAAWRALWLVRDHALDVPGTQIVVRETEQRRELRGRKAANAERHRVLRENAEPNMGQNRRSGLPFSDPAVRLSGDRNRHGRGTAIARLRDTCTEGGHLPPSSEGGLLPMSRFFAFVLALAAVFASRAMAAPLYDADAVARIHAAIVDCAGCN